MYQFSNDILKSLNRDEVGILLYSIRDRYRGVYHAFEQGNPIKFIYDNNDVRVSIYTRVSKDKYGWTWANSIKDICEFYQTYLSIIRERKLNKIGITNEVSNS